MRSPARCRTWQDFANVPAEYAEAGASAGLGFSLATIKFPFSRSILLGGLELSKPGAGAKLAIGTWMITGGPIRGSRPVAIERAAIVPTIDRKTEHLRHTVNFELGRSELSPTERALLSGFAGIVQMHRSRS